MPTQFSQTTRSLEAERSPLAVALWLVGGAVLALWLAWMLFGTVTLYEMSARARVEVRALPHQVAPVLAGRIVSHRLEIGRAVAEGEVLLELDATQERLRLQEEQARLVALPGRIAALARERHALASGRDSEREANVAAVDGLRARRQETEATIAFARQNERRLRDQGAAGGVPQIDALRAAAELQRLVATRDAQAADLRRQESDGLVRGHQAQARIEELSREMLALEAEQATATATVARLQASIGQHVLRAPVAGRIAEMAPVTPGGYVAAGQRLASVLPAGELMLVADFHPATALGRLREGQSARMRLDGFPWPQFGAVEAEVKRVAGELRDDMLRAELAPGGGALLPMLRHGLPGVVEVEIERVAPATLLLRAAGLLLSPAQRPHP